MREKNHYKTLGIPTDADDKQIRGAYRSLARKYHPDAGEGSSADRFRDVQRAYDVLSDPSQRAAYDQSRRREAARRDASAVRIDWGGYSTARSAHIDLRNLSSRPAAEPLSFGRGARTQAREPAQDPWTDLIALLFDDFIF